MTQFQKIIIEQFIDGESIVDTIINYDFEEAFAPGLKLINEYVLSERFELLPTLVGSILVSTNEKLSKISDSNHKKTLEEIAKLLLEESVIALKQNEKGRECLTKCIAALKQTCELKQYNFSELSELLNLQNFQIVKRVVTEKIKKPYFDWLGKPEELTELSKDIQDQNIIKGIVNFKALFKPIEVKQFTFIGNQEKVDELVILFHILKQHNLIKPRILSGHFSPLEHYGIDNGEKLFAKKPNKVLETIKRNHSRYDRVYRSLETLVKSNCSETLGL